MECVVQFPRSRDSKRTYTTSGPSHPMSVGGAGSCHGRWGGWTQALQLSQSPLGEMSSGQALGSGTGLCRSCPVSAPLVRATPVSVCVTPAGAQTGAFWLLGRPPELWADSERPLCKPTTRTAKPRCQALFHAFKLTHLQLAPPPEAGAVFNPSLQLHFAPGHAASSVAGLERRRPAVRRETGL